MGGGCKLSGDSAVVCLGLRALFVRAVVGLWRAELWAHGAELCWLRNLSSLGHGMVFCPPNLSASFHLGQGWRHLSPFTKGLEAKADQLLQSLEDAWFGTIHNFCQAPAVPLPMGRFGSLSGASPMVPPHSSGTPGEKLTLLAGVKWWLTKSFPCFHCLLKR